MTFGDICSREGMQAMGATPEGLYNILQSKAQRSKKRFVIQNPEEADFRRMRVRAAQGHNRRAQEQFDMANVNDILTKVIATGATLGCTGPVVTTLTTSRVMASSLEAQEARRCGCTFILS